MGTPRMVRGGGARGWLRIAIMALATFAVVFGPYTQAGADELDDALRRKQELERAVQVSRQNAERYKQAANQFEAAVGAANSRIADLSNQRAAAQNQADILALGIQIAEEQLQLVAFQLNETKSLVESLKAQSAEEARQLAQREALYAKHLRTTYRQAQISPLEMLLSSESLSEFAARVQAMILINRQDAQIANEIRTLRIATAEKQAAATVKEEEIVGLEGQIRTQREGLAVQKAEYEAVVRSMQASIATQGELRNQAAGDRNSATANQRAANLETANLNKQLEIAEANYAYLAAQLALRSGLGAFNGRLAIWPVGGPITSGFGARWGGFHNGIDIAAPMYRPVVASASGKVVTAGRPYVASGDHAVVVIIAHGNNFSTLYGHLDDSRPLPVSVGQTVAAGQVVGFIGMTGWTTGPHLHFMTIVGGAVRDPRAYLP